MTGLLSEDKLLENLTKCNPHIFLHNSDLKIIGIRTLRKNENIYQALIQVDKTCYERALKAERIVVGYDTCRIYDVVEVYRCYKCNEYHHSAENCKNQQVCPICGCNHDVKQCQSETKKCSNCDKYNTKSSKNVPTNHAVWEKDKCSAFKIACDKFRNDLLTVK